MLSCPPERLFCKDRIRSADRHTRAAVDALRRVDEELSHFFKTRLILLGLDTIRGADVDAKCVLNSGIGDYISHGNGSEMRLLSVLLDCEFRAR